MDLNVTGKFIQERRKEKGLTQAQLAEKLFVSEKTISKWETGKGFPDTSLILPLCNELEINANELLSGEKITDENYKQKAEENIIETLKKEHGEKSLYKKSFNYFTIGTLLLTVSALILAILYVGYQFIILKLNGELMSSFIVEAIVICLIIVGNAFCCVALFIKIERDIVKYECEKCHNDFYYERPNYIIKKNREKNRKLKCPYCKEKTNCIHKKG